MNFFLVLPHDNIFIYLLSQRTKSADLPHHDGSQLKAMAFGFSKASRESSGLSPGASVHPISRLGMGISIPWYVISYLKDFDEI